MKRENLPGMFISKDALEKYIHTILEKGYSGNYTFHLVKENPQQLQYEVTCGGQVPALLIAYIRQDGSLSLSHKSGSNHDLGKKIADAVYQLCGRDHNSWQPQKALRCNEELLKQILSDLKSKSSLTLVSQKTEPEAVYTFADSEGHTLTIKYWQTGKIYPQSRDRRLITVFNDTFARLVDFSSSRDVEAEIEALDFAEEELVILDNMIELKLGHDLNAYLGRHNPKAYASVRAAFKDKRQKQTSHSDDYSSVVQQICRCYEALMKTLFVNAGLEEKKFVLDYMYWNRRTRKYCLDNQYLPAMGYQKRYELGDLYSNAYGRYRNDVSHGGPPNAHFVVTNYEQACSWFEKVVRSMVLSFSIMKRYVGS